MTARSPGARTAVAHGLGPRPRMTPLATVSPRERPPATPTLHVRALPVTILRNEALAALPARAVAASN